MYKENKMQRNESGKSLPQKPQKPLLKIIEDTREARPLDFTNIKGVEVVRHGLKTGDYSVFGYENQICWERKSVQDLVGTLIGSHDRFLREIDRMKSFEEKYILVEHTPSIVYQYCARKGWQYKFDTIIQSLLAYSAHCGVRVRFCKNREDMAGYIVRKAREYLGQKEKEHEEKIQTTQG